MGAPRIQPAGSYTAMISDALDVARRRVVVADLGYDAATLSHWCDPTQTNGRRMPVEALHALGAMSPPAALVIARHFGALASAEVREIVEPVATLAAAVAALTRAAGEVGAHLVEATDPEGPGGGAITPAELRELQQLVAALSMSVAATHARIMREAS